MAFFEDEGNRRIFLNPVALDYSFIPKLIPYRENQQHHIATCIKPLLQNRNGKNLFIHGKPGIGKTVATMHVLNEMEEKTDIAPIYINCWKKNTAHKIILEICERVGYKFTLNKSTDELTEIITGILNKGSCVICLDECDKMEYNDIIYDLLENIYKKTIILITNNKSWLDKLDMRIKSRLNCDLIEFKPYNYEETLGILKQRIEYAFHPNTLNKEALEKISKKSFELQDVRTGIYLLKESGDIAEFKNKNKIEVEDVDESIKKLDNFKIKDSEDIDEILNDILELIKLNDGKSSRELFDIYGKDSYKTFKRKLNELEKNKLISTKEVNSGLHGKKTIVNYGSLKKLSEY
ncbi:AAA family ATPase [Candidatus Woesearchaeota archaeon]|nr:AAA family ATPase [Candidatus Woesearchaeota archaeon]